MNVTSSRVPHLARAIAEQRGLKTIATNILFESALPLSKPPSLRLFTSTTTLYQQKLPNRSSSTAQQSSPDSKPPPPPPPPSSLPSSRQPRYVPKDLKRPSRPASHGVTFPETPVAERLYDPSKDVKRVTRYFIVTCCFAIVIGAYCSYVYMSYRIDVREYNTSEGKLKQDADVSDRWWNTKRDFDEEVELQEKFMWLKFKRQRLIREAYGDVLEVSVGTGRNMGLYDTRPYAATEDATYGRSRRHMITSLTFNDQSPVMVEQAQKKWRIEQQKKKEREKFTGHVYFVTGDAGEEDTIKRPQGGYDTIVQSMGVCSMPEPVEFLRHLGRLVRQPGEPVHNSSPAKSRNDEEEEGKGGRIFLLEHGRGYDTNWTKWLNHYLDDSAAMHADRYGCWQNKDIGKIIEDSGLIIERIRRYYLGTVWEIVLRPAPNLQRTESVQSHSAPASEATRQRQQGNILSWLSRFWE